VRVIGKELIIKEESDKLRKIGDVHFDCQSMNIACMRVFFMCGEQITSARRWRETYAEYMPI
jgi:hypothetical protein